MVKSNLLPPARAAYCEHCGTGPTCVVCGRDDSYDNGCDLPDGTAVTRTTRFVRGCTVLTVTTEWTDRYTNRRMYQRTHAAVKGHAVTLHAAARLGKLHGWATVQGPERYVN